MRVRRPNREGLLTVAIACCAFGCGSGGLQAVTGSIDSAVRSVDLGSSPPTTPPDLSETLAPGGDGAGDSGTSPAPELPDLSDPGPPASDGPDNAIDMQSSPASPTWAQTTSGSSAMLFDAWGDGTGRLWVVGDKGTILHSDDGKTWAAQTSGVEEMLRAVWGTAGAAELYAVGYGGVVLGSADAGAHWVELTSPGAIDLFSVWGSGSDDLYVGGMPTATSAPSAAHSTDGGHSWTAEPANVADVYAFWGTGPGQVWVGGGDGVQQSLDGGQTFSPLSARITGVADLWGADGLHLFATLMDSPMGGGQTFGVVAESSDGGDTWTMDDALPPGVWLWGISGNGLGDVLAVGANGTVVSRSSGWAREPVPTGQPLWGVWVGPDDEAVVVGGSGTILVRAPSTQP